MSNNVWLALSQLIKLIRQDQPTALVKPYPRLRNFILDIMREGRKKNTINLILETDVQIIKEHLSRYKIVTGEIVSLTSYIAKSFACTIQQDLSIQAYRQGKSKLIVFDEIDLSVMVEREIDEEKIPVVQIIRNANNKSASQIHGELQKAKLTPLGAEGPLSAMDKLFFEMPTLIRRLVWKYIRYDPYLFKQVVGTVGITSMGMFSVGQSVVFPITPMTLTLSIGSIGKQVVLVDEKAIEREIIWLNLGADHDIIDGAPLMRFADRFKIILANGSALFLDIDNGVSSDLEEIIPSSAIK